LVTHSQVRSAIVPLQLVIDRTGSEQYSI